MLAFSFWPIFSGRFCHQGVLIPLAECISLFFLSGFLARSQGRLKIFSAIFVGLSAGLCSLTFTSWPVVTLAIVIAVFFSSELEIMESRNRRLLIVFMLSLLAGLTPFIAALLREGYGGHLWGSSGLTGWYSLPHQIVTSLSYITILFWGSLQGGTSYCPLEGGFLNPIMGGGFWLGTAVLYQYRSVAFVRWLIFAILLCLLPGLFSADYVETFRIIQVMPLVLLVVGLGFQHLMGMKSFGWNGAFLVLCLIFSFSLDFYRFLSPGLILETGKRIEFKKRENNENYRLFEYLEKINSRQGPGLIFSSFLPLSRGYAFDVVSYHFNAACNPRLNPAQVKWAGILTNQYYQPFLSKRFPGAEWIKLEKGAIVPEGVLTVGIVSISPENREMFNRWMEAQNFFRELHLEAEKAFNGEKLFHQALDHFRRGYYLVQGDPFLEASYWEWAAQYYYDPLNNGNIFALRQAIQNGYPAAHLYEKLGTLLAADHNNGEAHKAFETASTLKENFARGLKGAGGKNP